MSRGSRDSRAKAVFIDSGRTKKHTALVVGSDGRSRVRSLSNLSRLVKLGLNEVYIDQLFPTMYADMLERVLAYAEYSRRH